MGLSKVRLFAGCKGLCSWLVARGNTHRRRCAEWPSDAVQQGMQMQPGLALSLHLGEGQAAGGDPVGAAPIQSQHARGPQLQL